MSSWLYYTYWLTIMSVIYVVVVCCLIWTFNIVSLGPVQSLKQSCSFYVIFNFISKSIFNISNNYLTEVIYFRILSSLNLPAAIEDVSGTEVPASVVEKSQKVHELGGLQVLDQLLSDLPESLNRNKEILDEVKSNATTVTTTRTWHTVPEINTFTANGDKRNFL